ncbi:hypothetical protein C2I19_16375 [Chromobacterium alticapitis]|uniref:Uncharacterized protein n=1 Tax=Chromobacterium alticapitis TaxID=2073169 RepID=A0A2S5DCQ2_9NEIS|nr:hypothetical protein C2I19_16375 [Chromobacterium alticapitis]
MPLQQRLSTTIQSQRIRARNGLAVRLGLSVDTVFAGEAAVCCCATRLWLLRLRRGLGGMIQQCARRRLEQLLSGLSLFKRRA